MFIDEAPMEWYKQSVVSKDSNLDGPTNLFHEYDVLSNANTLDANMEGVFIYDENTGGQLEDVGTI